jgi:hypothetical protein
MTHMTTPGQSASWPVLGCAAIAPGATSAGAADASKPVVK